MVKDSTFKKLLEDYAESDREVLKLKKDNLELLFKMADLAQKYNGVMQDYLKLANRHAELNQAVILNTELASKMLLN